MHPSAQKSHVHSPTPAVTHLPLCSRDKVRLTQEMERAQESIEKRKVGGTQRNYLPQQTLPALLWPGTCISSHDLEDSSAQGVCICNSNLQSVPAWFLPNLNQTLLQESIRQAVRGCDEAPGLTSIPEEAFTADVSWVVKGSMCSNINTRSRCSIGCQ